MGTKSIFILFCHSLSVWTPAQVPTKGTAAIKEIGCSAPAEQILKIYNHPLTSRPGAAQFYARPASTPQLTPHPTLNRDAHPCARLSSYRPIIPAGPSDSAIKARFSIRKYLLNIPIIINSEMTSFPPNFAPLHPMPVPISSLHSGSSG